MSPSGTQLSRTEHALTGQNTNDDDFLAFKTPDFSGTLGSPTVDGPVSPVNASVGVIPKAYIVQLAPGASLKRRSVSHPPPLPPPASPWLDYVPRFADQNSGVRVGDEHFQFHRRAGESIEYSTRLEFKDPEVFLGLSIQVKDDNNASTIKQIPGVVGVWPVKNLPRPAPIGCITTGNMVGADNKTYHVTARAGFGADVNYPHKMTGVDKLHALGIKGRGIKIAVMDTGVDYHHPALGGCFGTGCKIAFGKSFVDDTGAAVTSDDPLATCVGGGHGSHTTGIIGMQDPFGSTFGLVGVAPEATLGMYRIFGCSGGASNDVIMLAFQQAVEDKVDILSMSLGSVEQWQTEECVFSSPPPARL